MQEQLSSRMDTTARRKFATERHPTSGRKATEEKEKKEDIILNTTVHGVFSLTREVRLRSKKFNPSTVILPLDLTDPKWDNNA
ncbi:hypothetical protein Clacol_004235 [Clathrus columnatus]|uniref:Uncharacterized protein n=1 Tax=Clathrus columnatus TaxID=1419009 RepID=A0AAV5A9W0_9AGAM|nr:hypothetical protein Clacol_004235 [Clathrus columnatus]